MYKISQQNFYNIKYYKVHSTSLIQVYFTLKETRKLDEIYRALEKQEKTYINIMQINKQIRLCFNQNNPMRFIFADINEEKQNSYCATLLIHAFNLQERNSYQFNDQDAFMYFVTHINAAISDNRNNANIINLAPTGPQLLQVNMRVEPIHEMVFKPCTVNPFQTCKCDIGTECFKQNHDDGTELLSVTYKKSVQKYLLIQQVQAYGLSKQTLQNFNNQFDIEMFNKFLAIFLLPFVKNIESAQSFPSLQQQDIYQPPYQQIIDQYDIQKDNYNDFKY